VSVSAPHVTVRLFSIAGRDETFRFHFKYSRHNSYCLSWLNVSNPLLHVMFPFLFFYKHDVSFSRPNIVILSISLLLPTSLFHFRSLPNPTIPLLIPTRPSTSISYLVFTERDLFVCHLCSWIPFRLFSPILSTMSFLIA